MGATGRCDKWARQAGTPHPAPNTVIPAQAGIQTREPPRVEPQRQRLWIPAYAGMTDVA
ncbi:hypothetical protein HD841_001204 [Sphingomonas melonis]|uniref:Uncharacterized protein n=1 Tax=Sphingomonas melonis TaxID=152682 RepID=A0A7Y9K2H4_9SPHN|nr:hypothetical protein [Sphingomonas melonis]